MVKGETEIATLFEELLRAYTDILGSGRAGRTHTNTRTHTHTHGYTHTEIRTRASRGNQIHTHCLFTHTHIHTYTQRKWKDDWMTGSRLGMKARWGGVEMLPHTHTDTQDE